MADLQRRVIASQDSRIGALAEESGLSRGSVALYVGALARG